MNTRWVIKEIVGVGITNSPFKKCKNIPQGFYKLYFKNSWNKRYFNIYTVNDTIFMEGFINKWLHKY